MKTILLKIFFFITVAISYAWSAPSDNIIADGLQPQLSQDVKGTIRVVFGRNDSIFCATSKDGGVSFSKPAIVGHIAGMHLGMTRGPQIASSANYTITTAMDKSGDIHFFQLIHTSNKWQYKGLINDIKASAPEGLMDITADSQDNFYAVWLDVRQGHKNNISFSSFSGKENRWTKNKLIYISPDDHVCECCKPSISVKRSNVNIMFRNWVNGSRDLYLISSTNKGETFEEANKLGAGTWKLKGCPMDGGGVMTDLTGNAHTVWQRQGEIYYCQADENEVKLTNGRSCSIAANNKNIIAFQNGGEVKIINLKDKNEIIIGKGSFLRTTVTSEGKIFCMWEQDKKIMYKIITLPGLSYSGGGTN